MSYEMYARRRRSLQAAIGADCVAIIPGNAPCLRNNDVEYPFRQNSDFFYLTGWTEPNALLLIRGGTGPCSTLFCQPKDPLKELWGGVRIGPKKAVRVFGFDEACGIADEDALYANIRNITDAVEIVACTSPEHSGVFAKLVMGLERSRGTRDLSYIIGEMRLIKDADEIALMKKAGEVCGNAHRNILHFVRPEMYEYEVEAELSRTFRNGGGDALHAYPSIVAGGKNACTLHYTKNNALLKGGELLLVDAGCELGGYASDITRTFPVGGLWSKPQRALYEIVLRAQTEAIRCSKVGVALGYIHDVARREIIDGLLGLGLIKAKDSEEAFTLGLDKKFFPHGTSHWLGLDVHDVGDYERKNTSRRSERLLAPGMVITVEPGLYLPSRSVPKEYRGIGIRIEDDVLITDAGPTVLSHLAPKDPDDIESIMQCGMV